MTEEVKFVLFIIFSDYKEYEDFLEFRFSVTFCERVQKNVFFQLQINLSFLEVF